MKQIWLICVMGASCQAMQAVIGNVDVYPERTTHVGGRAESFILTRVTPDHMGDVLEELKVPVDSSYGRYPDGAREWYFYTQSTKW